MKIVNYPHPALRWKSRPVTQIDKQLRTTVRKMFDLMYEHRGVGLAANQVALPYRLFVVNITAEADEKDEEFVFINPEIVQRKGTDVNEEGCLSLPSLYGQVRRAEEIVVEAFDLKGRQFSLEVKDLPSRVIQHENDHLDGVLFVDRMTESGRRELEPQLADFETLFRRQQESGEFPTDDEIRKTLRKLEPV